MKKKLQSMIIVTFTKLFVINIVASRRSLSDNKSLILESDGCLRSAIVFKSAGESEKKAISEAEANPDTSKRRPAKTMATMDGTVGACTVIPLKTSANWHK